MWIKICGMTTAAAVEAALAVRVAAIGFVFAPSVRELTPQAARARPATIKCWLARGLAPQRIQRLM